MARYIVSGGNISTGITLNYDSMYIYSGGEANSTTVNRFGDMYISNGGVANSTTVNSYGWMYISSGGEANSTTVNSDGCMYISFGGEANSTTVNSYGWMCISNGGVANSTTVNSSGRMYIFSGGEANSTTVNSSGRMYIYNGGVANITTVNSRGSMYIYSGGVANSTTVNSGGDMDISSGGTATNIIATSGAGLGITVALDTYIQGTYAGSAFEMKNAQISGYTINSHGNMYISNGGEANSTTVNSYGWMCISNGGVANSTTVNSDGFMYISSGGEANSTTVNSSGRMYISSGGVANRTTVNSWGSMYISSGGTHCGSLQIASGATVSAYSGAVIDFTVSGMSSADDYLINDLSLIYGAPTYTITVSANQSNGVYKLAQGAATFNKTITVGNGTVDYGTLSANGSVLEYNGATYQLLLDFGNLTLQIGENKSEFCASNLLANGTSQIVAWDKEKGAVGFVATDGNESPAWRGVWDWDGADVDLWRVVGVGHFAGSQVDHDGILLYNGIGTTFAAWTNLNSGDYGYVDLCHVEGNFNTKTLTDLDGDEYDDVLIYDEKGSFGVVLDGASYQDIWHAEDAASNPWQLKGAGKFSGSEEKLIVQNTSGHLYLWTNNDKTFNTWNWSQEAIGYLGNEWEFITSGDFAGDGTDDIIVRKLSDGGLWLWDDGKENTAHWVGTPGEGFKVEAVGDYNGDGKEDLLLREYLTGWGGVGYWASADASKWTDLNARIETDLESKFSVIA